jgi:hypothetical protein
MSHKKIALYAFFCFFSFILFADNLIGEDENRIKADSSRIELNTEEIRAIQTWTNGGRSSNAIQDLLLKPIIFSNPARYPESRKTARWIDNVLNKYSLPVAVTVYRAMGLSLESFEDLVDVKGIVGADGNIDTNRLSNIRFRHKTYAASSFDEQVGKNLVTGKVSGGLQYTKDWKYLLILEINVPVGTHCMYMCEAQKARRTRVRLTRYPDERELLIARDQDMKVKGTPQNRGSVIIPPARELKVIYMEVELEPRSPTPIP